MSSENNESLNSGYHVTDPDSPSAHNHAQVYSNTDSEPDVYPVAFADSVTGHLMAAALAEELAAHAADPSLNPPGSTPPMTDANGVDVPEKYYYDQYDTCTQCGIVWLTWFQFCQHNNGCGWVAACIANNVQ